MKFALFILGVSFFGRFAIGCGMGMPGVFSTPDDVDGGYYLTHEVESSTPSDELTAKWMQLISNFYPVPRIDVAFGKTSAHHPSGYFRGSIAIFPPRPEDREYIEQKVKDWEGKMVFGKPLHFRKIKGVIIPFEVRLNFDDNTEKTLKANTYYFPGPKSAYRKQCSFYEPFRNEDARPFYNSLVELFGSKQKLFALSQAVEKEVASIDLGGRYEILLEDEPVIPTSNGAGVEERDCKKLACLPFTRQE